MKNVLGLISILLLAGCMGNGSSKYAYRCVDGDTIYYADHPSAIIATEDSVVIGHCEPTSDLKG